MKDQWTSPPSLTPRGQVMTGLHSIGPGQRTRKHKAKFNCVGASRKSICKLLMKIVKYNIHNVVGHQSAYSAGVRRLKVWNSANEDRP
jgi:hypothetical protein